MRISGSLLVTACGVLFMTNVLQTSPLRAEDSHVVNASDLQKAVLEASQARQAHLEEVKHFLSSEPAKSALKGARIDTGRVVEAISQLDDQELARLASRTRNLEKDIAAGALSNQQLTYIIIALATAVIILIILAA